MLKSVQVHKQPARQALSEARPGQASERLMRVENARLNDIRVLSGPVCMVNKTKEKFQSFQIVAFNRQSTAKWRHFGELFYQFALLWCTNNTLDAPQKQQSRNDDDDEREEGEREIDT